MKGKVILITGGASGIGKAIALAAAQAAMRTVVLDKAIELGEQVAEAISRGGGEAIFVHADVSDAAQVKNAFDDAIKKYGQIDVLVNNAGAPGRFSLLIDMPDETWHRTIAVHLYGTFYCLREAARIMSQTGFGRIINIASIAGILGTVGSGEYGAAKAGIINLTKTASKELAPHNITVNAIAPGMVATEINKELQDKGSAFIRAATNGTPTCRMTEPDHIAALVLFLSSQAACNITGQVIVIDGGAAHTIGVDSFMSEFLSKKSPTLQRDKN